MKQDTIRKAGSETEIRKVAKQYGTKALFSHTFTGTYPNGERYTKDVWMTEISAAKAQAAFWSNHVKNYSESNY